MQVVVDMDDSLYHRLKVSECDPKRAWADITDVLEAIHNGKPLPKGHGRLIDVDKIDSWMDIEYAGKEIKDINEIPTVIEADKTESEVQDAT